MRRLSRWLSVAWLLACCVAVIPVIGDHAEAAAPSEVLSCQGGAGPTLLPAPRLTTTLDMSLPAAGTPADAGVGLTLRRWHLDSGSLDATVLFARLARYLAYQALLL